MRAGLRAVGEFLESDALSNAPPLVDPEELARLKAMGLKDMLVEARLAAIRQLLLKVSSMEASAAEIAVLRNLLRDNGMILGLDNLGDALDGGKEPPTTYAMGFALPELDDDMDEEE